ncbi:leucyl aminopeptidase [Parahaliea maris]|uniref:Probable cytosol aminopeptidase n=1 Tax=Parahaliea maris TaxID=2716870 RepID=A0A5C9A8B0_9GAMM|nr:leucyl aminopeptidase [Parahaliea maris]TXS95461.1 leucyl aminopeptidase [Parahaliea maris]
MTSITFTARQSADATKGKTQCAIVPVFGKTLSAAAQDFDKASDGAVTAVVKLGDFEGKVGQSSMLTGLGNAQRVLLLGFGPIDKFDQSTAREVTAALYRRLNKSGASDAVIHLGDLADAKVDVEEVLEQLPRQLIESAYRYTKTVSKPKKALALRKLGVNPGKALATARAQGALDRGSHIGHGVNLARNLANLPGNICTPTFLAQQARSLSRGHKKLSTSVLEEKKMQELGMGSLLSVSAGSDQPAKLIVMEYKGGKAKDKPYVLVGKGITFDTGGISLKPGAKMDEMKFDMGGAASVFGTMQAVRDLELPLNVVGIVAAAENMPSGRATKPGDVVTSMSGKTIEVLNTDAEGRLVLCDALTYAERFKPAAVVDIATLTGACVVALGSHASGLYANKDELADQLLTAGQQTWDRAWRMPLWDDYHKQLASNFADLANIGGPGGGSITAACFLSKFAENYDWAHLDIAGSAWDSTPKGATGRPVPLLTRYLQERAASA